jgi:hypothetical protein
VAPPSSAAVTDLTLPSRRNSLAMIVIDKDVMVPMTDGVRLALIPRVRGEPVGPVEPLHAVTFETRVLSD